MGGNLGVSGQYVLTWKTYCPVLSATARSQTDGGDVSILELAVRSVGVPQTPT